ncbi:hypothetical protein [Azospirillum sp. B4]|uniref:hypothetical protein n=1 Tax=Azospirillum sp. B4 TaxID=95605 RepID=UPI00034CD210|nr:hypothetical protein [Azospirillum sp. B4]
MALVLVLDTMATPATVLRLAGATTADLARIEVETFGLGLHFLRLDADLYVPVLLEDVLGSKRWMAEHSPGPDAGGAKATAAQENGKRGGRSKKLSA